MDPRVERALRDIALHTDRSFQTVERVFRMLMKAIQFDTVLMMIDGRLKAVKEGKRNRLPSYLQDEINASYDDVAALAAPIYSACYDAVKDEDQDDDRPPT
jgi:hypothetical protein